MVIYNSLSGKKEKLAIPKNRPLKLFVCGPTVYDKAHIGHARTYIIFDVIARFLRAQGIALIYLENITDVDDRIISRARGADENPFAIAKRYEKEFMAAMKDIGAVSVNHYIRASEHIHEIVAQIQTLIRKGYAYEIPRLGWYFDMKKFPRYGKLSRRTAAQADDSVSRIDASIKKKNRADFCLWKLVKTQKKVKPFARGIENGEPFWNTPLGYGRPGWHIEDTAITKKYFGAQYDMHGGGADLKFPHHEAEIAQAEAASGKRPFVRWWLHAGTLLVEGRKMSKSLKNFITVDEFLGKKEPEPRRITGELYGAERKRRAAILRLVTLNSHYRVPINFSESSERRAEQTYESISFSLDALKFAARRGAKGRVSKRARIIAGRMEKKFMREMENDFNTPAALAAFFMELQGARDAVFSLSRKDAQMLAKTAERLLSILGIAVKTEPIPKAIQKLTEKRELYRRNKQFVQSDALRKKAHALGYEVNDTPLGPFVRKKL